MKIFNTFTLLILLLPLSFHVNAQVAIEVFTDGPAELEVSPGMSVIHYDLSEPQRIKRDRAPKFPPNVDEAKRQAQAWFDSPAGLAYQSDMKNAYRGQQKLASYRLLKTPAIVFDHGKYVVYGSTDVVKAAQLYLQQLQKDNGS